jgi:3',5'-cyclic AMP phosphodiesterase CpdA
MARWLLFALLAAACSKASKESDRLQREAPGSGDSHVPADVSIAVAVDGTDKAPITSATLAATKPDFVDPERRAWRVATLVPEATTGSQVEAAGPTGVAVKFASPTPDGLEPVLFLTRRGDVVVAAVDPKDPFPKYHGQGGRLHRAGDTMPRVSPVAKLAITHP